jgi:hypothetical protein
MEELLTPKNAVGIGRHRNLVAEAISPKISGLPVQRQQRNIGRDVEDVDARTD